MDDQIKSEEWERVLDCLNAALGRYMIALTGSYEPVDVLGEPFGQPKFFCYPGFVLSVRDSWVFITAGHLLQEMKGKIGNPECKWVGLAWCQFVPDAPNHDVRPLDPQIARQLHCECDVVSGEACHQFTGKEDWGVMPLTPDERAWLSERGVKPFSESDLKTEFDCDGYVLMGLPTELFSKVRVHEGGATCEVDPTIIGTCKRDDLIARINGAWFVGELLDEAQINLHGMSGGPLFAFDITNDTFDCWIAGVQSHWCPEERLTFVCPMKTILGRLPREFRPGV